MMHKPEVASFRAPALKDGVSSRSRVRSRAGREPQLPGDLGTGVWQQQAEPEPYRSMVCLRAPHVQGCSLGPETRCRGSIIQGKSYQWLLSSSERRAN